MFNQNIDIKKEFHNHFISLLARDRMIMSFFYEIFVYGTAYIVGGYFRDFIIKKASRDIDVIVDIESSLLLEIIENSNLNYTINRHGGIKIKLESLDLDIWCLENNWAFKNNLVKLNEEDKLNSIAKGCFYNYDSLVINLHNFSYNLRYYKDFIQTKKLNILQEKSIYKNLNPTTEANILRAFYLKKVYGISFTENTFYYLLNKIGYLEDKYKEGVCIRLAEIKLRYPKYNELSDELISNYIIELKSKDLPNNQLILDF